MRFPEDPKSYNMISNPISDSVDVRLFHFLIAPVSGWSLNLWETILISKGRPKSGDRLIIFRVK
jgi:hypothetical protein